MKKLLLLLPFAALLIQACSNDFDIVTDWKEVPVVYAILEPDSSANYVRVEKAFLDPVTSALQIAQIADSLYYPESAITVMLEEVGTNKKFPLTRVDGNLEGIVREDGVFATQPNWLYKTAEPLLREKTYRLRIVRTDGQSDITAETTIPDTVRITTPSYSSSSLEVGFLRDKGATLVWNSNQNKADAFFTVHFRIRYSEYALNGTFLKRDTINWNAVPNIRRAEKQRLDGRYETRVEISTQSFFNLLVDKIAVDPNRFRRFDGIDISIAGGGSEIERYLETATANSGITGAELVSTYTNLSEGFGIFTAKNTTIIANVKISALTITDMNKQSPERDLGFQ